MHFQQIIQTIEKMKEHINVFLILHSEDITSDNMLIGSKVSTIGKLVDSAYNPAEVVNTILYSDITYDDKGFPKYGFYTNKFKTGQYEVLAKSPEGMFEDTFIPNDLKYVADTMEEYYN